MKLLHSGVFLDCVVIGASYCVTFIVAVIGLYYY